MQRRITLEHEWVLGDLIGRGGFSRVYEARSPEIEGDYAAKFIPKSEHREERETKFRMNDIRNVMPIVDRGETADSWVLIMPRAECSLRVFMQEQLPVEEAVGVLTDIATALVDLDNSVFHRDIKPENILRLDGTWHLADFGVSRSAAAETASRTWKDSFTVQYAAPEQLRLERATNRTDVYSLGIVGYEMILGHHPFSESGNAWADMREAHLKSLPPVLDDVDGVTPRLSALLQDCVHKIPESRPTARGILTRLDQSTARNDSGSAQSGLAKLQQANLIQVRANSDLSRRESMRQSEEARRKRLQQSAQQEHDRNSQWLLDALESAASAGKVTKRSDHNWKFVLGQATLTLGPLATVGPVSWGWEPPAFDVVATSEVSVTFARVNQYEGRSHSLWYCDAQETDEFRWFETAFMISPMIPRRSTVEPFARVPGEDSAKALWAGIAEYQVAWPFEALSDGTFVDRWASWFADASTGQLRYPRHMPERDPKSSWRTR